MSLISFHIKFVPFEKLAKSHDSFVEGYLVYQWAEQDREKGIDPNGPYRLLHQVRKMVVSLFCQMEIMDTTLCHVKLYRSPCHNRSLAGLQLLRKSMQSTR